MEIHKDIKKQLDYFYKIKKIPNIIFYGNNGSGKKTLLYNFLLQIYSNQENINKFTMIVNCAHGKGIKFIREELKFFSKTQINFTEELYFKSIVLLNADKLTIDAQSALRRCIELFNHSTRFFITLEDKNKLLKPILSRFSILHIPNPIKNKKEFNLYQLKPIIFKPNKELINKLTIIGETSDINIWLNTIDELYEEGISCLNILSLLENNYFNLLEKTKYEILFQYYKIKKEIRNEKILMLNLFTFIYS
jgi:DNA polymerase III delta prime subunit